MSIASRITSIEEHLTSDYEMLEKLGLYDSGNKNIENIASNLTPLYDATGDKTYLATNGIEGRTSQDGEPTPENPVEVVNLSGEQNVNVSGKNELVLSDKSVTKNGVTCTISNQDIVISGTNTSTSAYSLISQLGDLPQFELGKTYTLSTTNNLKDLYLQMNYYNGTSQKQLAYIPRNSNKIVFTIPSDYVSTAQIFIGVYGNATDVSQSFNITIQQGTEIISQDFPLSLKSKNLFNPSEFITKNNVSCSAGGVITSTGIPSSAWSYANRNIEILLSAGTYTFTVYFNAKGSGTNVLTARIFDSSNATLGDVNRNETDDTFSTTITLTEETNIGVCMKLRSGDIAYFQIEKGSTSTSYEPYYDIELCDIVDKDKIYSQDEKFYLEKQTQKKIIDGSYNWSYYTSGKYFYNTTILNDFPRSASGKKAIPFMSNRFIDTGRTAPNGDNQMILVQQPDRNNEVNIRYESIGTVVADFNTWLSTNNVEIILPLATPTTEEITSTNYPTLYSQLKAIQEYLIKYKISKEYILGYDEPVISY